MNALSRLAKKLLKIGRTRLAKTASFSCQTSTFRIVVRILFCRFSLCLLLCTRVQKSRDCFFHKYSLKDLHDTVILRFAEYPVETIREILRMTR